MSNTEAIRWLIAIEDKYIHGGDEEFDEKRKQAIKTAISALEKQIPKKPRVDSESWLCCPKCNETFAMFDRLNRRLLCCGCCGQKLDWSEVDAKKRSDNE